MVKPDIEAIKALSVPEEIWDSIQPTAEQLPLTEEQKAVIDERLAEHRRAPFSAVDWEDVKARLESR